MEFQNRIDAGRRLGDALRSLHLARPMVIGVARGGVPVAVEVARALDAAFDIRIVRKLIAPHGAPVTIGAVAEGAIYVDDVAVDKLGLSRADLDRSIAIELAEVERRAVLLREGSPLSVRGQDAIVVDDGAITGSTIHAVARGLRHRHPRSLTLALPIGATEVVERLRPAFDHVICLIEEPLVVAIGSRYETFWPVSDAEVAGTIASWHSAHPIAVAR